MQKEIRNIGILAHVDAGKTSITENILHVSGKTKSPGNVDSGTTISDFMEVEKERGISVKSSFISFDWKNTQINLVDTPGHIDFSSDVERALRVIDAAVLVISASEGVQAHTETIWKALSDKNLPTIIFINKIDRVGVDCDNVIDEIKKELTNDIIQFQDVVNESTLEAGIINLLSQSPLPEKILESIAGLDENILNKYLEEEKITNEEANNTIKKAVHSNTITPILLGSSKFGVGISELLNTIIEFLPAPKSDIQKPLSALVFSITHDKTMGKVTNIRLFDGHIKNREVIKFKNKEKEEKIIQIRKSLGNKFEILDNAIAGDIIGVCGLTNAKIGDIIGDNITMIPDEVSLHAPLLTVQVKPNKEKNYTALAEALTQLSEEDPSLEFEWLKDEKELHIKIMGQIQVEVLEKVLEQRFGINASFENPTVIYKETPSVSGDGFVRYWMPKPCWAILKFKIEPGETGSGVSYKSLVGVNDVKQRYQNEVERTIPIALAQGTKGWEVTDIKITLIEGEDHEMHSRAGDFVIATPMGIMNGLDQLGTTLLEPILKFKIVADESLLGNITSDITQMRGSFESPNMENGKVILTGLLPVSTSLDYPVKLSSRSGGKAKFTSQLAGYSKCTDDQGVIRPFKGISPLDTSKYILKARKAIQ